MLRGATVPSSLAGLLAVFRPCFTAPTFPTFVGLVVGLIAQTRRRTVCGMLTGAGLERVWHHSRAHRRFTSARWSGAGGGGGEGRRLVGRCGRGGLGRSERGPTAPGGFCAHDRGRRHLVQA